MNVSWGSCSEKMGKLGKQKKIFQIPNHQVAITSIALGKWPMASRWNQGGCRSLEMLEATQKPEVTKNLENHRKILENHSFLVIFTGEMMINIVPLDIDTDFRIEENTYAI